MNTIDPSFVAMASLALTGLLFPFVLYFFKKNERLHEDTQKRVGEHSVQLGVHEYRLISLEEWRRLQTGAIHPPNTTINNN